ncbi:MAG: ATP-binding protein [bacterium]
MKLIFILTVLLFIEGLAFFYFHVYLPLKRLRKQTEELAEGRSSPYPVPLPPPRSAFGIEGMAQNLEKIDARIAHLGYHVSTSRLNLHAILAGILEGVVVVDGSNRVKLANEALMRLFGLTNNPLEKPVRDALNNKEVQRAIDASRQERKRFSREIELEVLGGRRIFEMNAVPLLEVGDVHVQEGGVVATFHDITLIKGLEGMQREFVANVSHELRTPLSIFRSYLETLLDKPDWLNGDALKMAQVLKRHSDRLNLLVNDLLTLSRYEWGEISLEFSDIHMDLFFKQIQEDWAKAFAAKLCRLLVSPCEKLPPMRADRFRMEQIFYNLIQNALNYSNPQGVVELGASLEEDGKTARFFVKDNGAGIPADKLPHIFDRLFRVDPARSRDLGGSGLGLSIVRHIVRLHNGRAWAESELGKGTTVFFTIPLQPADLSVQALLDLERQPIAA